MLNLIRSDIYKMIKMKSFYVIMIVMFLAVFSSTFFTKISSQFVYQAEDSFEEGEKEDLQDAAETEESKKEFVKKFTSLSTLYK